MRAALLIALYLGVCAAAQAGEGGVPGTAATSQAEAPWPQPAAKAPRRADVERKPAASVAFVLTDDADSVRLPPFAARTTPFPTRFLRVGVEWSF
jgi:hypothetical protein